MSPVWHRSNDVCPARDESHFPNSRPRNLLCLWLPVPDHLPYTLLLDVELSAPMQPLPRDHRRQAVLRHATGPERANLAPRLGQMLDRHCPDLCDHWSRPFQYFRYLVRSYQTVHNPPQLLRATGH